MKKILVIGSNGYIGSALMEILTKSGKYSVIGVDSCWFDTPNCYTHIVIDYKTLSKDFLKIYDIVILLAGHSSVKMCEGNLMDSHKNNVDNFIELINKLDKKTKFIYASSSSVYGRCNSMADENYMNFIPYNNYDITKYIIDLYVQRFDIEYYGLRFGTVNGYSPIVRKDVMINAMYSSAINDGEIKLYIKDIIRPILGTADLIRAIETIIESKKDLRGLYNLASFNKTAEDIAYSVSEEIGVPVKEYETNPIDIISNPKLQTVCYDFKIDTTKFEKEFNFKFTETIKSIVSGLKNNLYIETIRNKSYKYD
jgi:nucleoside-diphosphate-sugar epimerase